MQVRFWSRVRRVIDLVSIRQSAWFSPGDRYTMANGWCTGNWRDVHNWVHPRCTRVGLPHKPHWIKEDV